MIYLAWKIAGPTDVAFFLLFVVSFSFALAAIWRADYRSAPLFLLIILASSAFYSCYGNVIRQAMAFPFIFLLARVRVKKTLLLYAFLAAIAHIPSLMVTMPFILFRLFGRVAIYVVGIIAGVVFFISKFSLQMLSTFGGGGDDYVSKKVDIYTSWESFNVVSIVAMVLMISLINNFMWRSISRQRPGDSDDIGTSVVYWLLCLSNLCLISIFATLNLSKVVERVYIYFFVISVFYLSVAIPRIRSESRKFVVCLAIVVYSVFGISKNLWAQDLLYGGDSARYVVGSVIEIYKFMF